MFWTKWLINLTLACLVTFFGTKIYKIWSVPPTPPLKIAHVSPKKKAEPRPKAVLKKKRIQPDSYYQVIVDKNLFSPDRKGPEPEAKEQRSKEPEAKKRPPANIILYGVVIAGDYSKALLSNPDRKKDKRRFVWVSVGDSLGDYKLAEIQNEKVILERGGKRYDLTLYAGKKRRTSPPRTPQAKRRIKTRELEVKGAQRKKVPLRIFPEPKKRETSKGRGKIVNTPFGKMIRR